MAFITISEIFDIVIMAFAIGYIFSDFFKREPSEGYDPLTYFQRSSLFENIKYAAMIAAPAVVFHELAHKFVAMGFGAQATLHAPYFWYAIVILLKMMRFPLIFFVGGFVSHTALSALPSALVSIAGPATNFLIWAGILLTIKLNLVDRKYYKILVPMAKINLLLGIFNMLPLPGFDGYWFFKYLFSAF